MVRKLYGVRRTSVMVAVLLAALQVSTASADGGNDNRALSSRLDASLQAIHLARQQAGEAASVADRVTVRRFVPRHPAVAQAPGGAGSDLLELLVLHTAGADQLRVAGFTPQATVGQVSGGTLPVSRLGELAALDGVRFVQLSRPLTAYAGEVSVTAPAAGATGQRVRALSPGGDGAGVVIGFIDTGADIFHHDLRHDDGSTRIAFLLDFSLPGDVDGNGVLDGNGPYGGTLFSRAEIDAALAAGQFSQQDTTGHGTHGLSIAAGDDATCPGVAPAADLIVVKATRVAGSLSFSSIDIINALAFIDQKATELGQPYVVNLSLGTLFCSHDGRSLEEQAIDALVGPGVAGKAVVTAAGNSSDNSSGRYHHLSGTAYVGIPSSHTLTVDPYTPEPDQGNDRVVLDLWWQGNDRHSITVTGPASCGAPQVSAGYGTFTDVATPCGDVFIANMGGANPLNGDTEAIVLIDDWSGVAPSPGDWTLALTGEEVGDDGSYHGWLADESLLGWVAPYFSTGADNNHLVGKPGGAFHTITVGSHGYHAGGSRFATSWTDVNGIARSDTSAVNGGISGFSSPGPTRDGRIKPELTAPGERVRGAVSGDAFPGVSADSVYRYHPFAEADALIVDATPDNAFGMLQGTSFSAPVVTGLVARILSLAPGLDAEQIRNMLINSALADSFTGTVPNPVWGHGKADLALGSGALPPDLRITSDELPGGVVDQQYNHVLTASGGVLPYTWQVTGGSLPTGLSLDGSGFLTGVPATAGSFQVTVSVSSPPAQSSSKVFEIVVGDIGPLHITTVTHPVALLDRAYNSAVEAAGGAPPYTFSLAGGSLPDGLLLHDSGAVDGTPTVLDTYYFTVQVEDAIGTTALRSTKIRVKPQGGGVWDQLGHGIPEVVKVAADPADHRRMFCSVDRVGVFASNNGGDSWEIISINNGFPVSGRWASDLAISPSSGVLFAVTQVGYHGYSGQLLRWDETLGEWSLMPQAGGYWGPRLKFDSLGTALYGFSDDYQSSPDYKPVISCDEGFTWTSLSSHFFDSWSEWIDIGVYEADHDTMYISVGSKIWQTTDGGALWISVENEARAGDQKRVEVSQADRFDVVVLNSEGMWRTVNGGRRWTYLDVPDWWQHNGFDLERGIGDPQLLLTADPDGVLRSTDAGLTWERLPGLPVGPVADIEIIGDDPTQLVLGTNNGVYLTADGGLSWQQKNSGLLILDLVAVAISSQDPQTLFLLSDDGPLVSRNHGDSWILSSSGLEDYSDKKLLALSPAEVDLAFIVEERGIPGHRSSRLLRSDNRGVTWSETSPDFEPEFSFVAVAADPFDSEVVMAALEGSKGVYRSHDRGETWADAFAGLPFTPPTDLAFAADVEGRVFASYQLAGIYRSDDRGDTWVAHGLNGQTVSMVRPAPSDSEYVYALSEGSIWFLDPVVGSWQEATSNPTEPVLSLAVDPANPLVAYAGTDHPGDTGETGGLYTTADGGLTWTRIAGLLDQFDVVSVAIDPSDSATLFAATKHGGVYRSEDTGVTWTQITDYGTVAEQTNVTVQDPSNPFLLLAGTQGYGVQVSADSGRTFEPRVEGLGNLDIAAIAVDPDDPTTVYAGSSAGIYVSADSAATWSPTALTAGEVTDMVTDNEGTGRCIWATVRGGGVAYSADGGTTFSVSATGLLSLELTGIAVEHLGSGRCIWATMRGGDGVASSTDLGQTWLSAAGSGLTDRNVNDIAVDGQGRCIWATTDSGVLYTKDAGASWHDLSLGLPSQVPVSSVTIDPITGEAFVSLLDASMGGVYRGGNITGVWSELNAGLGDLRVGRLTNDGGRVDEGGFAHTTLFASTQGRGVWAARIASEPAPPPVIDTTSLADGTATRPYSATLQASDGVPPYRWSLADGALPPGLVLHGDSGVIDGAPAIAGTSTFTVRVSDSNQRMATTQLSITVLPLTEALFADGFESGDTTAWAAAIGGS